MKIGLVYDLRDDYRAMGFSEEQVAEFDSPATIAALSQTLVELGHEVEPIGHIRHLAARLVAGSRWDLVFNIAEGLKGRSREAQVPALLEAYDIAYTFSDPLVMAVSLDKAVAKRLVAEAGIATPCHAVIATATDAEAVDLAYPLFVKPIAEGTGKGCELASIVHDSYQLKNAALALVARFDQPALVETYLPGREFTVGILGNGEDARVIAVMEIALNANAEPGVYSWTNKEECEERIDYALSDDATARAAGEVALAAYHTLQCRDAARIDIRCDGAGRAHFIEANPLAGLHPTHSDLPMLAAAAGMGYPALINGIVEAAARRSGLCDSRTVERAA
jgi:D-alanine-D-alanine ligase